MPGYGRRPLYRVAMPAAGRGVRQQRTATAKALALLGAEGEPGVLSASDFSLQGAPAGIGTVTFADTTTASAIDNNITVTIPFSTSMPSADDVRSLTIIGAGKPRGVQI